MSRSINLGVLDSPGRRTYVQESHPTEYIRVYLGPRSRMAHLMDASTDHHHEWALCGRGQSSHWNDWFGTGSQDEIDHAAELPLCPKCEKAVRE